MMMPLMRCAFCDVCYCANGAAVVLYRSFSNVADFYELEVCVWADVDAGAAAALRYFANAAAAAAFPRHRHRPPTVDPDQIVPSSWTLSRSPAASERHWLL